MNIKLRKRERIDSNSILQRIQFFKDTDSTMKISLRNAKNSKYKSTYCFPIFAILSTILLLAYNGRRKQLSSSYSDECWLRDAFRKKEFVVFSHRSFVNANEENQPSCAEALAESKSIGVHHFDIDLVLANNKTDADKLILSHPMEYKKTSSNYSPCYSLPLNKFIDLLDSTFGDDRDYFISMEPKASWSRTAEEKEDPALASPLDILIALLDVINRKNLKKGQCAVIVDTSTVKTTFEHQMLTSLTDQEHCQLFVGFRKSDTVSDRILDTHHITDESSNTFYYKYDSIMPTIEFHPQHKNSMTKQKNEIAVKNNAKSIYWVVDDIDTMRLAANFRPLGIVSNHPRKIVSILNDPKKWCK